MAFSGQASQLFNKTHVPAAATQATITQAAAGAGQVNVCNRISASIAAAATASGVCTLVLRDGPATTGTALWQMTLSCIAQGSDHIDIQGLNIVGSANTAMTLEFTAAGAAATVESVNLQGYTQSA